MRIVGAITLISLLSVAALATAGEERSGSASETETVIYRKDMGHAQIVCSVGPSRDSASLRDIAGQERTDRLASVYEFRVDWRSADAAPIRLWSALLGVTGKRVVEGRWKEIAPQSPEAKEHVKVLDLIVIRPTPQTPACLALVMRNPGGPSLSLCRVGYGGWGANEWSLHDHEWTEYDTTPPNDPASVTLSVSPEGVCGAEVVSARRHTLYRQCDGKWEFVVEKQWEEPAK